MYNMKIKEKEFQESKEFINQAINISNEIKNQAKNYNFANAIQINQLDLKIEKLDDKIENLYHAVNSNPEKSLSIPMINKDIDNLEDKVKILSDNFDHQIDRTYQMFMWVCGTLALGVLGLIITVVIAFKQK
ncbi:hypothetical protein [Erwinia sp. CGal63]|uniref:hypothetical protein n=1 Tax=Erwinia sp. CGal63 TaxID=2919889 RepID=UPI003008BDA8